MTIFSLEIKWSFGDRVHLVRSFDTLVDNVTFLSKFISRSSDDDNLRLFMDATKPAKAGTNKIKVIICDDHIAIRSGLRSILEEENFVVVETCDNHPALIAAITKCPDAIVITDLGIGGMSFQDVVREIHQHLKECRIIVYSMREAAATIGVCYDAGVLAFVPKAADIQELVKAIQAASEGKKYFTAKVAEELANLHTDKFNPKNLLSERELQILLYFVECSTAEAVSAKYKIPWGTVHNALSRITKKLGVPRNNFYKLVSKYALDGTH